MRSVENATPPPRVVRASNLHDVRQAAWFAGAGALVMLASVAYLWSHHRGVEAGQPLAIAAALGATWSPVFCVLIPLLTLCFSGTWIADDRGIEFIPYAARLRRWTFLTWDEVQRVKWMRGGAVLEGADGERITLAWTHLPEAEAQPLRLKVESAIRDHFDLVPPSRRAAQPLSGAPSFAARCE